MPRATLLSSFALASAVVLESSAATAAITKGPWIARVTPTSAVVRFELDAAAPASVQIGLESGASRDAGIRTFDSAEARTLHTVTLTGLEPSTRYAYSVNTANGRKLAAVKTAPSEDSQAPFRFLVYGDNRSDDAAHAAVVRGMVPVQADFLVHTGDFVEDGSSPSQWQTFFDVEAPLLRERCLVSCVGNHELIDGLGADYVRYFGEPLAMPADGGVPEHLDATFRWAGARFFLLNGMVGWRSGADRDWLERVLTQADSEKDLLWRIVVVHHGPWSSGPHGNSKLLHDAGIPALLRAHKIDLVIAGHDHVYERGWAEGMAYLVSGGGGAPAYRIKSALASARKYEAVRHFVEASVSQAAISFSALRPDGSVIERCGLRKELGWDCDAPPPSPPAAAPERAPSPPASRCACHAVGAPLGSEGGACAAVFVAVACFALRRRREILDVCASRSSSS